MDDSVNGIGVVRRQFVALIARNRRFTARHRVVAWFPVLTIAAAVGFGVQGHVSALDRTRRSWQQRTSVLTAVHPISAGSPILRTDVALVELPSAGAAPTAVREFPAGAVALDDLAAGEVLLTNHLLSAATGRVPPGMRGVSIARTDGSLEVTAGDAVQVIAVSDLTNGPTGASPGVGGDAEPPTIADRAVVIEVSDAAVLIAVEEAAAPGVAQAAASNHAVLILRPT